MDSQSLPFGFVEASGLQQQIADGCATNHLVTAKPPTAKRDLRCQDKEAISVRCEIVSYNDGTPYVVIATSPLDSRSWLGDR